MFNNKSILSRSEMAQISGGFDSLACRKCCIGTSCSSCNGGNFCTKGELTNCSSGECTIQ